MPTSLSPAAVSEAASLLLASWQNQSRIDHLPETCRPSSREEGYAIAEALASQSGSAVLGWKIAATSVAGQRHINVDGPLAGRLLANRMVKRDAPVPLLSNIMKVAEAEFAFRFAKDLPRRAEPYEIAETLDAVSTLHLSLEVPDSRYRDFTKVGAAQLIADTACACWLIVGPAVTADWRSVDLAAHKVMGYLDGAFHSEGIGKAVLGDPRIALAWLVNEVATYGPGIKAGDIVTTGTCIVPVPIGQGSHVRFDYGPFGEIEAKIA